ncbi:DNA ligase (NAD(+)) LigA, partial [bacterium]
MDRESIIARIASLREQIKRHNRLYHAQGRPEISDGEFDVLERELRELETIHPELAPGESPLSRPGSDADSRFPSEPHSRPMLSLQNSYDPDEVSAFVRRVHDGLGQSDVLFTVEPKIDGVAVALRYREGHLVKGLTRGDGRHGDVITAQAANITGLPENLGRG